ncbi:MAG: tripartite tricarboxylate transporter TctB family protein, partial [Hyphomicrobiaceae bacterium]
DSNGRDVSMTEQAREAPPERASSTDAILSGRIAATLLLVFSVVYGIGGATIEYAFSSDPLGPRAVPVLLATLLAGFSLWYLAQPGEAEPWPHGVALRDKIILIVATAVLVRFIPVLGFPIPIGVLCVIVARMFGAGWLFAVLGGLVQGFGWWALFWSLGVILPFWPRLEEFPRLFTNPFGT